MIVQYVFINVILLLIVLFMLFNIIKRTKGILKKGAKLFFLAFLFMLADEVMELLVVLNFVYMARIVIIKSVGFLIILVLIFKLNKKIRAMKNHRKKKKYGK